MYRGLFQNDWKSLFWRLNGGSMFKGLLGSQLPAMQIHYIALKFFPTSLRLNQFEPQCSLTRSFHSDVYF